MKIISAFSNAEFCSCSVSVEDILSFEFSTKEALPFSDDRGEYYLFKSAIAQNSSDCKPISLVIRVLMAT
ncbi:hypothetical protein AB3R30_17430 [Leptolyngbyaceae cyanobacterium UHCC 1019]